MRRILIITTLFLTVLIGSGSKIIAQNQQDFNLELYFNRDLTEADRIKIKDNIHQYSQQILANPKDPVPLVNRGVQYAHLGLFPDAITDYNKAIKLDSTLAEAYYNRGIARARFGYTKTACVDLKKAAKLGLGAGSSLYNKKCGLYIKELGPVE
jgi:tetratricopeptide (TPR) repeat protein